MYVSDKHVPRFTQDGRDTALDAGLAADLALAAVKLPVVAGAVRAAVVQEVLAQQLRKTVVSSAYTRRRRGGKGRIPARGIAGSRNTLRGTCVAAPQCSSIP